MQRFETHTHSEYSNIRLLDATNRLDKILDRAKELNLNRIALTDHECLSGIVKWYKLSKEKQVKIAIGNEIYLTKDRTMKQKYYHFILIAKDEIGLRQLRILSSESWMQSYFDRGLERVPTTYDELEKMIKSNPGHLIGQSACLGGYLSSQILAMCEAKHINDIEKYETINKQIDNWLSYMKSLFNDDFYIEIAPGLSKDQITANKILIQLADEKGFKVVIGTDAHYLTKEDRQIHKAFLNSKDGEREIDDFYQYAYLQDEEDIKKNLGEFKNRYEEFCQNSLDESEKICNDYNLLATQKIPKVPVKDYPKKKVNDIKQYENLSYMFESDDVYDRYWINQCYDKLKEIDKFNKKYLDELELECDTKRTIGKSLETNVFAYPITLQHYINMMWDCGSIVGAGRGSSCAGLNHYLLGVTQLDPVQWKFPFFRYLNKERKELPDIDLDLCPSKRPIIINKIKEERGEWINKDLNEVSRKNLGATMCATFGTCTLKNAIAVACRGYRSKEYPDGIDIDISQFLSSLVPQERGKTWTLKEVLNGNEEEDKKPVVMFKKLVDEYPGLLDIIKNIEGLITRRGIHASGVFFFDEDPYKYACFMKAPSGEVMTQWDLHDAEAAGLTKYDFLVTDVCDMITQTIKFLQEDGQIEPELTLRQAYDKYLHPNVLPLNDKNIWNKIKLNKILRLFQFDSPIGGQGIAKVQPDNINELTATNALIRLMPEKGEETPMDKFIRFKDSNLGLWYEEMNNYNLTKEEQEYFKKYLLETNGIGISQEQLMLVLMDEHLGRFTLAEANQARKTIAKKLSKDKIKELQNLIKSKAVNENIANYIWDAVVRPQSGYSFSVIHSSAYSVIGFQTAYLATDFDPIYWNTSCLVINSGSLDETESSGKDYAKIATAIGEITSQGITLSLININKSDYSFKPDVDNNQILYGLNGVARLNADMINMIKQKRPYNSLKDFINKCPLSKLPVINLIKAGAFEKIDKELPTRYEQMIYYLRQTSEPKKRITMQNINGLLTYNLIPVNNAHSLFEFNRYLINFVSGDNYTLNERSINYFNKELSKYLDNINCIDNNCSINSKVWKDIYTKEIKERCGEYVKSNAAELLDKINNELFKAEWNKYIKSNNLSAWEMDSLCFYKGEHELAKLDYSRYDVVEFSDLIENDVNYMFRKDGKDIPLYKLNTIVGTVIAKNDTRHTVFLITPYSGVITAKFSREQYAKYKTQIKDNHHIVETGWFTKGNKLLLTGYRNGESSFQVKTYAKTNKHQIEWITKINNDNTIEKTAVRYSSATAQECDEEYNNGEF